MRTSSAISRWAIAAAFSALTLLAADPQLYWPQWRGPNLNGSSTTAKNLPLRWSQTENVAWRVKLPSWSAATPIVWGDVIFVTSAQEGFYSPVSYTGRAGDSAERSSLPNVDISAERGGIYLLAVNRSDGSIRWRKLIGSGNRIYRKQNLASPSPVTDGRHVWALTGNGMLTAFDFTGRLIWKREIQKDYGDFGQSHGYASSPLLHGDRLYLQVLHGKKTDKNSYLLAIDKLSGKTVWKADRLTDAVSESRDSYSTPILVQVDGRSEIVVSGGDYVTGHDLAHGVELWRLGGLNPKRSRYNRTIASSVAAGPVVCSSSRQGRPLIAFRPSDEGRLPDSAVLWKSNLGGDVPTPASDGKRFFIVDDRGIVHCIDSLTGRPVWDHKRIEAGTYSASMLLADGKLYATAEDGATTVMSAGEQFEILAVNRLEGHTLASPVAAGEQIFIRTADYLYCLQKK